VDVEACHDYSEIFRMISCIFEMVKGRRNDVLDVENANARFGNDNGLVEEKRFYLDIAAEIIIIH